MSQPTDPWAFECPHCHAAKGRHCHDGYGGARIRRTHKKRLDLAEEARKAAEAEETPDDPS